MLDYSQIRALLQSPIAFHRIFADIAGGAVPGLFLSQAFYWTQRGDQEGWFWKTQEQWEQETALTRYEQESARKKLKALGVLEEKKKGLPALLYFRVVPDALVVMVAEFYQEHAIKDVVFPHPSMTEIHILVSGKPADLPAGNPHPYNTEIISENISETTDSAREKKVSKEKSQKTNVPDEFPVTVEMLNYAKFIGFRGNAEWVIHQTQTFIARARSKGEKYIDWYSAWQTWMRNCITYGTDLPKGGENGVQVHRNGNRANERSDRSSRLSSTGQQLARQRAELDRLEAQANTRGDIIQSE